MRILHVISGLDPQNGGPTVALVGLATAQKSVGMDVSILATWKIPDGLPVARQLQERGVKVTMVGPASGTLSWHPEIKKKMAEAVGRADVVHIHGLFEEVQHRAAREAQRQGVRYIITPHGMLSPWNMSRSKWRKRIYMLLRLRRNLDRAAAIHFTSEVERDLVAPLKIKAGVVMEGLGLELEEFRELPAKGSFRAAFGMVGQKRILLFLGRIDYKKGLDVLIPAFAAAKLENTLLVIAGPDRDGYKPAVVKMIEECGIGDQVYFTGMLRGRQRIEAYVDADLFVLTSHQENFGITVIEAMASGAAVLISNQVNIHREVANAQAGEVIADTVPASVEGMRKWMADESGRRRAGDAGRKFAMENYDWIAIAERWIQHYRQYSSGGQESDPTAISPRR
jgi:glycosyltransferase involved in cell wall biosynthesis